MALPRRLPGPVDRLTSGRYTLGSVLGTWLLVTGFLVTLFFSMTVLDADQRGRLVGQEHRVVAEVSGVAGRERCNRYHTGPARQVTWTSAGRPRTGWLTDCTGDGLPDPGARVSVWVTPSGDHVHRQRTPHLAATLALVSAALGMFATLFMGGLGLLARRARRG